MAAAFAEASIASAMIAGIKPVSQGFCLPGARTWSWPHGCQRSQFLKLEYVTNVGVSTELLDVGGAGIAQAKAHAKVA